jgi:hypothetical protein
MECGYRGTSRGQSYCEGCGARELRDQYDPLPPEIESVRFGSVYIVRSVGTCLVKIGFTGRRVEQRVLELQIGSAGQLVLERVFDGVYQATERYFHDAFRVRRRHGEWFELTEAEVASIRRK